jgi:hypothetical protein
MRNRRFACLRAAVVGAESGLAAGAAARIATRCGVAINRLMACSDSVLFRSDCT